MLNGVEQSNELENLRHHTLTLKEIINDLQKTQLMMAEQYEKLLNCEIEKIAKEVIKEILNVDSYGKRLSKAQQMKADANKLSTQRKLDLIKKHTSNQY